MKKKLFRIIGYVFCALLMVLCVLLIFAAAVFGSRKTVEVFGFNVYIVENDDIPAAPNGSAVFVRKVKVEDLAEGRLVLYTKSGADGSEPAPVLGYVKGVEFRDGVAYITVAHHNEAYDFTESSLVGSADYSSKFWGGAISFIKTPLGVMVIALIPCLVLILFDIIRAAYLRRPEPEVVPRVKNADEDDEEDARVSPRLSVNSEGKASYSKSRSAKPLPKDSTVLFNYAADAKPVGRQKPRGGEASRPIIPLTDKKPEAPAKERAEVGTGTLFDIRIPPEAELSSGADAAESGSRPAVVADLSKPAKPPKREADELPPRSPLVSEKDAELAVSRRSSDAFFAQSGVNSRAPVGRQVTAPQIGGKRSQASDSAAPLPVRTAGKRSTQILASKSFDELLSDDDDTSYSRSSSQSSLQNARDRAVDDIFAGIDKRRSGG